jgi:hypothetical protein
MRKGDLMSKDAAAVLYTKLLVDLDFRDAVSSDVLASHDLTADERAMLLREVHALGARQAAWGEMMSYVRAGPGLSPGIASALGAAVNAARGLPTNGIRERGHTSGNSDCCPWNKPPVPWREGISE